MSVTLLFYAPDDAAAVFWTVHLRCAPTLMHATEAAQHCLHVIGSDLRVAGTQIEPQGRAATAAAACFSFFFSQQRKRPIVHVYTRYGPRGRSPTTSTLPASSLARAAAFIGGLTPQRLHLYACAWRMDEAPCTRAHARRQATQAEARHPAP